MLEEQVPKTSRSPQDGQAQYLELWVEAAGMVPMAFNAVNPKYGVPVFSSGGFDSTARPSTTPPCASSTGTDRPS